MNKGDGEKLLLGVWAVFCALQGCGLLVNCVLPPCTEDQPCLETWNSASLMVMWSVGDVGKDVWMYLG